MRRLLLAGMTLLAAQLPLHAAATEIVRQPTPGAPISQTVRIPPGAERLLVSGQLAPPLTPGGPNNRLEDYGDTRTQAAGILRSVVRILGENGFGAGDVVRMQVFLVADPNAPSNVQLDAFNAAYNEVFGTPEQPNRPVRSLFEVSRLVRPWWLVEVEVEAVRMAR